MEFVRGDHRLFCCPRTICISGASFAFIFFLSSIPPYPKKRTDTCVVDFRYVKWKPFTTLRSRYHTPSSPPQPRTPPHPSQTSPLGPRRWHPASPRPQSAPHPCGPSRRQPAPASGPTSSAQCQCPWGSTPGPVSDLQYSFGSEPSSRICRVPFHSRFALKLSGPQSRSSLPAEIVR